MLKFNLIEEQLSENKKVFSKSIKQLKSKIEQKADQNLYLVQTKDEYSKKFRSVINFDNNSFASCSHDNQIKIWNSSSFELLNTLQNNQRKNHFYNQMEMTSIVKLSNRQIASGHNEGSIRLWNGFEKNFVQTKTLDSGLHRIDYLALLTDEFFASALSDNSILVCDKTLFEITTRIENAHTAKITDIISLTNFSFASASQDKTIKIWNTLNGELEKTLQDNYQILCLRRLDDKTFASSSSDKTVKLWNMHSGLLVKTIPLLNTAYSMEILPNGHLIVGLDDGNIQIFNPLSDEITFKTIQAHSGVIRSLVILNNSHLITAGDDNKMKKWNWN